MEIQEQAIVAESHIWLRTVVVVDMVGYSRMARLLDENAGAGAVAELNRQIQALVQSGLSALPAGAACLTLAETGDGAILVFDVAEDAHRFAEQMLVDANRQNEGRESKTAMRWFRIGIASGELKRLKSDEADGGYAGITIANATRLEGAAQPGEIVIDLATYKALPAQARKLYGAEAIVRGKRSEVFRVRKYKVATTSGHGAPIQISRRGMLGMAAGATAVAAVGGWIKFGDASRWLHPLPLKRFVALHMWPKPEQDVLAIVNLLVGSIEQRLTRAEPRDKQFMVMVPDDPLFAASGSATPGTEPAEVASALGANLVLAANLKRAGEKLNLTLRLLDPSTQSVLRHQELSSDLKSVSGLSRFAAEAAAKLLELPPADRVLADEEEVSGMNADAYQLLAGARVQVDTANDAGLDQGIEQLQRLVNQYPRYAIGYAELANAYLTKFQATQNMGILELAKRNTQRALQLNQDSLRSILSVARADVFRGETDAAFTQLNRALELDPMNPEVLLYKAATLRTLGRSAEEETVYRQITTNRPNYWVAYNELGGVLKTEAKYPEAIEAYQTATQIAPKVAMPLTNLGILYVQTAENAKAKQALDRSIAIHPSDTAYVGLGDMDFEAGNYKQAIVNFSKAHDLNPKDSEILRDLGDCYTMTKDPAKVKDTFEQAALLLADQMKINPKDGPAWMTLSFYHAKVGRFEDAGKEIATAEKLGAMDVESQLTKSQTVFLMGRSDEALQIVLKCLDRGISRTNVELAVDLKEIRNDPRYKARVDRKS